jgi:hypothetical protein
MKTHKLIIPAEVLGNKLFPTEAINSVQTKLNLSIVDLKTKLFTDAILYEKPIIQISHVLGSSKTALVFEEKPDLLSEDIFTIALTKKSFSSYREYVADEKYRTKKKELARLGIKYSQAEHRRLELFADQKNLTSKERLDHANQVLNLIRDKSQTVVYCNPQELIPRFKEVLFDSYLIVSKFSRKKNHSKALNALKVIIETGSYFEPSWTQHLLEKKIGNELELRPRTLRACDELVESSYFLAGGAFLQASIGLDMNYYPAVFQRLKKTADKAYLRKEVFRKMLDFHGLDPNAISNLSVDSLKSIRKDPVTRKLRRVIDKTSKGSDQTTGISIMKELAETVASESQRGKSSKLLMRVTLFALNAFPPLVNIGGDLLLEYLTERYPTIPIHLFCTKIFPKEVAKSRSLEYL